jgi:biotin carboxylase
MEKTLLILSGGIEAAGAARRAKDMGLYVVVSDRDPQAPGFAHADSCIIADVYSPEETLAAARRYALKLRKLDGVICVAADAPLTAATVAQHLGLPGISTDSAKLATDKLAMKERFLAAGVPVPWFSPVATPQALQRMAVERGRDLIVKPVDGRGSSGMQRVSAAADLAKAFMLARQHSPTERVMAEDYLSGPRIAAESIIADGRCYTPALADHDCDYTPFFTANSGELPSRLPEDIQDKAKDVVARAAIALGITSGAVAADIVIHHDEPHVIEFAARLSGGFCTSEMPRRTGVDILGAAIRLALGEAPRELEAKM